MKLIFLGTSAAQPTEHRGLSCTCLIREGEILMFDAGEATQFAFQKAGLGWNKKMKIFVTHLHGDHCIGILALLQSMTMKGRTKLLEIYGPEGIKEFIKTSIEILKSKLPFPLKISTTHEGIVYNSKAYTITACHARHSVSAFAYLFKERDKPGKFYPEKARELGIPKGNSWKQLQTGNTITVDGKTITPDQVRGKERLGKSVGISGDTIPTIQLEKFFSGCDYLVFDATFLDELEEQAKKTNHSTAKQAATLGRNAEVKNLILTHFSARYANEEEHLREAELIHDSVIAATDLLEVDIE